MRPVHTRHKKEVIRENASNRRPKMQYESNFDQNKDSRKKSTIFFVFVTIRIEISFQFVKLLLDQLPFESLLIELVNQKLISARSYRTNCVGWLNVLFHSVLSFQYLAGCVFVLL